MEGDGKGLATSRKSTPQLLRVSTQYWYIFEHDGEGKRIIRVFVLKLSQNHTIPTRARQRAMYHILTPGGQQISNNRARNITK